MKKLYLIGKSLKHSISPLIHNRILSFLKIDAVYSNIELPDYDRLKEFVEMVKRDKDVVGFNITIPYKEDILEFCDDFSEDVKIIQAANTVKKENGRLKAYNTDWLGFKRSLEETGIDIKEKRILILGAGGAAKACIYGLYRMGAEEIFVFNRNSWKVLELKSQFGDLVKIDPVTIDTVFDFEIDIIINATPIGMNGHSEGQVPFGMDRFIPERRNQLVLVYDTIYNPLTTKLLSIAKENDILVQNGLKMLVYQAMFANMIWFENKMEISLRFIQQITEMASDYIIQLETQS
ncbi:shikimate dehydrogenase [Caldicellulosiruptor morganii]|uniref:Shikimate dehydrogenase (NADP(+)) n=1 Tax=Caldicellulosiruptor morganii TaxID=1387555 RepID=A0ABY7BP11_9FIRM|nr:shikimate dehydrogenase [Caldicellulosiruptor morganii]WAM34553.1 shikimate dehydrogenase [Caldicellulosiruptor morganii]